MKKKKLKLDQLKVSSFVTEVDDIKGGKAAGTFNSECDGNTHVYCSGDVACDMRFTFMDADTGGCKFSDLGNTCEIRTGTIGTRLPRLP